jgi:pyrroline-5-carboxylate reductase
MRILIIGGGNMGLTFAKSFLTTHIVTAEEMYILEKSPEKAEDLKNQGVGTVFGKPGPWISEVDLIILAVKPQDTNDVFPNLKPFIDPQQVILSIMAGVTIKSISKALGSNKIVRAMPNLPAQIGVGMTVYTSAPEVTRIELVMVQNLVNATGKAIYVESETSIDAATAVSGSGPAYVFYFMQSLIEAAEDMGFTRAEAELLSYQTFKGAIDLFNKSSLTCEQWIKMVMSKGGTTEAAFDHFKSTAIKENFKDGVQKAFERAQELGR